jgi:hypothetical protein
MLFCMWSGGLHRHVNENPTQRGHVSKRHVSKPILHIIEYFSTSAIPVKMELNNRFRMPRIIWVLGSLRLHSSAKDLAIHMIMPRRSFQRSKATTSWIYFDGPSLFPTSSPLASAISQRSTCCLCKNKRYNCVREITSRIW